MAVVKWATPPASGEPMRPLLFLTPLAFSVLSAQIVPCDTCLPGVENFAKLDGVLWRGAQPTAEGFRALEQAGARTIVSFRHDHDDLPLMKGTKLRYLRIPSRAWRAREKDIAAFLKVLEDPANHPVYIHCAQGRDRTGYNAAAYRIVVQGWTAEAALKEMHAFRFNTVWVGNPGFLKRLDPARMKALMERVPQPSLLGTPDGRP